MSNVGSRGGEPARTAGHALARESWSLMIPDVNTLTFLRRLVHHVSSKYGDSCAERSIPQFTIVQDQFIAFVDRHLPFVIERNLE